MARSQAAHRVGGVAIALALVLTVTVGQLAGAPTPAAAATASVPTGFTDAVAISGLTEPTSIRFASDGRIFVAEKSGLIKEFDSVADTSATIVADLRTQVYNYWDRGLLSLALAPGFPADPWIYVMYTHDALPGGTDPHWGTVGGTSDDCPTPPGPTDDGCVATGRISRLQISGNTAVGNEQVLVDGWCQQFPSHSMGTLAFGPDGALYASAGDGASFSGIDYGQFGSPLNPCGDPPGGVGTTQVASTSEGGSLRAQDLLTSGDPVGLNGTVIRIDPATGAAFPGNPLAANADANARRIVAFGLRNPYRMTFRPGTSDIYVGDVGFDTWEEVDKLTVPGTGTPPDYGWPCYEGPGKQWAWEVAGNNLCDGLYAQNPKTVADPVFAYNHGDAVVTGDGCGIAAGAAISGVAFGPTSGTNYPTAYRGAFYFADYTRGCIWMAPAKADGTPDFTLRKKFVVGAAGPVELQIGTGGDLFYVDFDNGRIHRLTYNSGNLAPTAVATATPTNGPAPLTVAFDGSPSSDPEGGPLTYAWDLDGDGAFDDSTIVNPTQVFATPGTFTVRLRVTDNQGATGVGSVTVTPGNSAPQAVIDTPANPPLWSVGDSISFSGHASDAQEGALPPAKLSWTLLMHHCFDVSSCHIHSIQTFSGVSSGSFIAPDHDYPSYLELQLTATDAGGLTSTTSLRLDPQPVDLSFASVPAGITLAVGSASVTTPGTETVIHGSTVSVAAPATQVVGTKQYQFVSWSDGGARAHDVVAAAATTLTATYAEATPVVIPGSTTVVEGSSGIHAVQVPVTLSRSSLLPVTVSWSTLFQSGLGGSPAVPPGDYTPTSGTVTFAPGQTAKTVSVPINGDTINEPDEYALLSWTNATNATIGGYYGLGFLTLQNDDAVPAVVPGAVTVVEGSSGTTTMSLPVTLSSPSTQTVTASWSTTRPAGLTGAPADAPADYQAASGTVSFAPGETAKTVSITINGDAIDEPDEYLLVAFSAPTNATIGGFLGLGFGTIQDDDPPPVVVPGSGSVAEGDAGTTSLAVPVTLSAPSGRSVTVSWATTIPAPGAVAMADAVDYVAASGTVTFAPGETSKVVLITVNGDVTFEPDELVVVRFSAPTNASLGGYYGLGLGAITNDDAAAGSVVPPTRTWSRYD